MQPSGVREQSIRWQLRYRPRRERNCRFAAQPGHSDKRMAEKHYAHLSPGTIADTVRANFGEMGIVEMGKVERLGRGG